MLEQVLRELLRVLKIIKIEKKKKIKESKDLTFLFIFDFFKIKIQYLNHVIFFYYTQLTYEN